MSRRIKVGDIVTCKDFHDEEWIVINLRGNYNRMSTIAHKNSSYDFPWKVTGYNTELPSKYIGYQAWNINTAVLTFIREHNPIWLDNKGIV